MTEMHPSDRTYRNQLVRLPDLTVTDDTITNATFENCTLVGPAVVIFLGATSITGCTFDGDEVGLMWPIGDRDHLIGAIGLSDCTIVGCRFQRMGIAYTPAQEDVLRREFGF